MKALTNRREDIDATHVNREVRILMLEDTPTDAELAEHELRNAGIDFISIRVETRDAFVRALEEFCPEIVLSDYSLPAFNGMAALEIMRRDHPEVPVVMVTGALSDLQAVELIHAGARDYVLKDRLARLGTAVQRVLSMEQANRARKAAEKAWRESEALYRSLITAMAEGVCLQQANGVITAVNPAAERILGRSAEQMLDRPFEDPQWGAIFEDGTPFPRELHPAMVTLRAGEPQSDVVMGIHKSSGSLVWISINSQPLVADGESTPYAVVTTFHDITKLKHAEQSLRNSNRELRAISHCNQALIRTEDEQTLLNDICRIICEKAGYHLAWVGYVEHDDGKAIRPVAWAGFDSRDIADIKLTWSDDTERGQGPAGKAIRSGEVFYGQDFATDPQMAAWREGALLREYRSVIALPLKDESATVFGVLLIYSEEIDTISPEEIRLLKELSNDLAFGIMVLRARNDLKRAEQERQAHLRSCQNLDRVNRAIQGANDLEQMTSDVLDVVLSIFDCDRAFLMYPCDPEAASWQASMERHRPECPEIDPLGLGTPIDREVAGTLRLLLESDRPVKFGAGTEHPVPTDIFERFGVKSAMSMAVYPRADKPWQFGIQQCSRQRVWTSDEEELLQEIGRRFADGQASLLAYRALQESETRLRTLVQTIPDLVWLKDPEGAYLGCNPQFEHFFGANEAQIVGKTDYDFVDREQADFFRQNDLKAMAAGKPHANEEWLTFAENGYRGLFEAIKTPMRDRAGRLIGVVGIARDITERKKAEEQLRIAATAFEAQEGIVITDANLVILRVNRAFTDITGYAPEDVVGRTPQLLQSDRHDAAFYRAMWNSILLNGSWQGEIWNKRKNGEIYPEWLTITAVKSEGDEISHYVGTMIDITARKAAEKEIEHLAFYDLLTLLPNRRLLLDRLHQALAVSIRSRRNGALLFIDLDQFKNLNDTSGHDVGDRLLVEVAQRLGVSVRDGDTIARIGGDEFVVMLEHLSECPQEAAAQAKGVGEKILAALNQPYTIAGQVHHSTPSIGVILFPNIGDSVDEIMKKADIAMYQAKAAGRNTLRFFDPDIQATLAARATLEAALRFAIQNRQFVLHYQPQVDGARGVIGAEALLRWQHPEHGMVSPAQFIPMAEETAMILPIGKWVLEAACARLKVWAGDPRTRDLSLAVNVSARQFRQADFVSQVTAALEESGAPAARLKLELTESLVLDNVKDTTEKMQALKRLGVGFSMDDFGTGYSSLSYLTRLPLDQVKIDQSFVRNLPDSPSDAAVVQTIITMAKSLGLAVIAEGVETEAQRQFLEQHGCPIYQGYLFSKPVPLAAFEQLLICRGRNKAMFHEC